MDWNAVPTVKITLGMPFPGVPAENDPWLYLASFLTYFIFKNATTLKSRSGVTQGYRNWYHSYGFLWAIRLQNAQLL